MGASQSKVDAPINFSYARSRKTDSQRNNDIALNQFFQSFRVKSSMLSSVGGENNNSECCIQLPSTIACLGEELPTDMVQVILSFLSPAELYPLRYMSRHFHVLVERVMERWVKDREASLSSSSELVTSHEVKSRDDVAFMKELFTSFDFESGLYSDVFGSWADLARNRYLYEQLVPNCCTREDIELLKSSRGVGTGPRFKVTVLGSVMAGKTMFCQRVILDPLTSPVHSNNDNAGGALGADLSSATFSLGGTEANRFTLVFCDTAGPPRCEPLHAPYVSGARVLLFLLPLDEPCRYDVREWLERLHARFCSGDVDTVVVGTRRDLKKDNRLSYDVMSFCVRNQMPYHECDLRDSEQLFRVLYAIMHYGLLQWKHIV